MDGRSDRDALTRMIILAQSVFDFTEKGKTFTGIKIILAHLKKGILEKLRCPLCGAPLKIHDYHKRYFHNLDTDEQIAFLIPQVICTGQHCPHYDHRVREPRYKDGKNIPVGATHLVFPAFICPYIRINSKYVTLLSRAQDVLNNVEASTLSPDSKEFRHLERYNRLLHAIKLQAGDLWDYLKGYLNCRSGQFFLAYSKFMYVKCGEVFKNYVLHHFYSKHTGVINGFIRTGTYKITPPLHSISSVMRILLSEFVQRRSIWSLWPPNDFFRELLQFRKTGEKA